MDNSSGEDGLVDSQNPTLQLEKERRTVSFDTYDLAVRQILDMVQSKDINTAPEYQRKFVWEDTRQSEFIESVFLGIPIPSVFMATNKDSTWEVVDGVQRLSTLVHFAGSTEQRTAALGSDAPLVLKGLEKLTTFNGQPFEKLPRSIQLAFMTRPIRVTVLNDKSDMGVRFDLFERLNSGGVKLQEQEIRNCVYRGAFNDKLKVLAGDAHFRKTIKLSPADETNGTPEEFVLRFFAFLDNYRTFEHSVRDFLNSYMERANRQLPASVVGNTFQKTFDFLVKELPGGIVRGGGITPVNLYEAIAAGTGLAFSEGIEPKTGVVATLLRDEKLKDLTTGGTNSRRMVVGRIELVRDKLR